MLEKNLPVTIGLKALDWDYLNTSFKKGSDTNFTGNVKFVAYLVDESGFGYDTKDLVYDNRYSIKLSKKATKEDFLQKLKDLKSFYMSSLESLQKINHSSYKVNKEEIASDEELSDLLVEANQLYIRWPSLLAIDSNWKDKQNPCYTGNFLLTIFEKSRIGIYDGNIVKVKIKFNFDEFDTYQDFSDKIDVMCDRWDTFVKLTEDEKFEIYGKISQS
jgi:hypothetical protein